VNFVPFCGVRIPAACGFLTTLLYIVLSVFPVINVASRPTFTVKVGGTVLAVNAVGALYFWFAQRSRQNAAASA